MSKNTSVMVLHELRDDTVVTIRVLHRQMNVEDKL